MEARQRITYQDILNRDQKIVDLKYNVAALRDRLEKASAQHTKDVAEIAELENKIAIQNEMIEKMGCEKDGAVCILNYYDLLIEFKIPHPHCGNADNGPAPFDALVGWRRNALEREATLTSKLDVANARVNIFLDACHYLKGKFDAAQARNAELEETLNTIALGPFDNTMEACFIARTALEPKP